MPCHTKEDGCYYGYTAICYIALHNVFFLHLSDCDWLVGIIIKPDIFSEWSQLSWSFFFLTVRLQSSCRII